MKLPSATSSGLRAAIQGLVDVRRSVLDNTEIVAIDEAILVLMDYLDVLELAESFAASFAASIANRNGEPT